MTSMARHGRVVNEKGDDNIIFACAYSYVVVDKSKERLTGRLNLGK
jgi:hypothetical protein